MNREELFELHQSLSARALEIMRAKNQDYAGKSGDDPFANFSRSEVLGICRELGLMLRVMDKFCRIKSFIESGTLAVKGEPVDDAILDIINYMVLLQGMIVENRRATTVASDTAPSLVDIAREVGDVVVSQRLLNGGCPVCGGFYGKSAHFCAGPKDLDERFRGDSL